MFGHAGLDLTWKKSAHEMLDHKCVCLLVDLADLCTVSHANFVFVMMQYLDCRHRSVEAALVG